MVTTPAKRKVAITFEDDDDDDDDDDVDDSNANGDYDDDDEGDDNNNGNTSNNAAAAATTRTDAEDEITTAKTPIASSSSTNNDNRTPGSSGGMIMRSGKKKKRPKPSSNTNSNSESVAAATGADGDGAIINRRARKRTKLNGDDDNGGKKSGNDDDDAISSVDGREAEDDEDMGEFSDNNEKVGSPVVNGNGGLQQHGTMISTAATAASASTTTTTAQKVPPAMTREAIAQAQVTELPIEEEDDDDNEQDEEEADEELAPAVAAVVGAANVGRGFLHLLSQKLRLPSQHTPKPPTRHNMVSDSALSSAQSSALAPPPPPPGGRRLIFETASKTSNSTTTATTRAAATTTAAAAAAAAASTAEEGVGRNKLLLQTRQQQQQQQRTTTKKTTSTATTTTPGVASSSSSSETQTSIGGGASQEEEEQNDTNIESSTPFTSLQTQIQHEWHSNKHQLILYTQRWFIILLLCFVGAEVFLVSTMWNVHGDSSSSISTKWREWHGILPPTDITRIDNDSATTAPLGGEQPMDSANAEGKTVVTVTDPILLANARAKIRADRMNLYDIQKLQHDMITMQTSLKLLEEVVHGWTVNYPAVMNLVMEEAGFNSTSETSSPSSSNGSEFSLANTLILDNITSTIEEKQNYLVDWEMALLAAEQALDAYDTNDIPPSEVNGAILALSHVSMMKFDNAMLLDPEERIIVLPGEGCGGMDYIPLEGDYVDDEDHDEDEDKEYDEDQEYDAEQVGAGLDDYDEEDTDEHNERDNDDEEQVDEHDNGEEDVKEGERDDDEGHEDDNEHDDDDDDEEDYDEDIDIDAFDPDGDSPVRLEDAQSIYDRLMQFVESTSEALFGDVSTSSDSQPSPTKRWAQQIIQEELRKKGVDAEPPSIEKLLHEPITLKYVEKSSSSTSSTSSYSTRDAVRDIDHRLEIEDADRTGQFDYASVIYGARILRRGPFATSYSYYETLPLLNRLLAYSKLRFYGHPPEVALYPTFPMHARGQCWSFSNEATSVRSRRLNDVVANDMVGEYATLTVSLVSAIRVTEIVVEHPPSDISSSSSSAIQEFRVLGFEDGGAFGEPWELGRYTFDVRGSSLQSFAIPTTLLGQNIPKLKSISIAIDSNWGSEYGCLYRVRVHGE